VQYHSSLTCLPLPQSASFPLLSPRSLAFLKQNGRKLSWSLGALRTGGIHCNNAICLTRVSRIPRSGEASKPATTTQRSLSILESPVEPVVLEEPVMAPGGLERKQSSARPNIEEGRRGAQERGSTSGRSSASDSERSRAMASGTLGRSSACSNDSDFESGRAMHHFRIDLPPQLLECGAQGHSLLQTPGAGPADRGTMRRMALRMVQDRHRWATIKLLLRRGADPNLSRVPMQVLFFAVKAGDVDGVRLLLENRARTDIQFPPELGALTPLHIAAALPGEEGVKITELLLHAITDVDARAADQDDVYKQAKLDLLPSSLKLNSEAGPPSIYYSRCTSVPDEGGRTALHVACEREDNHRCARDVVRLLLAHGASPNVLWSGHSPLSLSIASGNDLVVKELLSCGADPNMLLTKGLGSALCVACDIIYESQRSLESRLALVSLDPLSGPCLQQGASWRFMGSCSLGKPTQKARQESLVCLESHWAWLWSGCRSLEFSVGDGEPCPGWGVGEPCPGGGEGWRVA
ncbi:hypothetical protein FD754_024239, partial [Muntiacus muntjak]